MCLPPRAQVLLEFHAHGKIPLLATHRAVMTYPCPSIKHSINYSWTAGEAGWPLFPPEKAAPYRPPHHNIKGWVCDARSHNGGRVCRRAGPAKQKEPARRAPAWKPSASVLDAVRDARRRSKAGPTERRGRAVRKREAAREPMAVAAASKAGGDAFPRRGRALSRASRATLERHHRLAGQAEALGLGVIHDGNLTA